MTAPAVVSQPHALNILGPLPTPSLSVSFSLPRICPGFPAYGCCGVVASRWRTSLGVLPSLRCPPIVGTAISRLFDNGLALRFEGNGETGRVICYIGRAVPYLHVVTTRLAAVLGRGMAEIWFRCFKRYYCSPEEWEGAGILKRYQSDNGFRVDIYTDNYSTDF